MICLSSRGLCHCFTPSRAWQAGRRARNVESMGLPPSRQRLLENEALLPCRRFPAGRPGPPSSHPGFSRKRRGDTLRERCHRWKKHRTDQEPPRGIRIQVARCPVSGRPWDTLGRRQCPSQFQSDTRRACLGSTSVAPQWRPRTSRRPNPYDRVEARGGVPALNGSAQVDPILL